MNEGKKDRRDPIRTVKPRNFVAKNMTTGGAGAHKDKKKAAKQGDTKHKNKEYAESLQAKLNIALAEESTSPEYNDEAGMAYGSLHTLKRAVDGLMNTIDSHDDLPEWCQEKISLAEDYLITVWDYLQSEKEQGIEPTIDEAGFGYNPDRDAEQEWDRHRQGDQNFRNRERNAGLDDEDNAWYSVVVVKKGKWEHTKAQPNKAGMNAAQNIINSLHAKYPSMHLGMMGPDGKVFNMGKGNVSESRVDEKSVSKAQFRTMAAVAHNPEFAKKVGIKPSVGKEFHKADKKQDYKKLPAKVESLRDPEDNPCWTGYKPVGTKKKNGKTVPNCVPKEGWTHDTLADQLFEHERSYKDKLSNMLNKKLGK
jgi:hypothetical protein